MKVFDYDMTIMTIRNYNNLPGFLIHDSDVFDSVDERQIAKVFRKVHFPIPRIFE